MGDLLKDRVAIITGSGGGIGRAEALAMAREGAKVVVNDYGVTREGADPSVGPAQGVVEEIKAMGGEAVASYESVADFQAAKRIVQTAVDSFGRVDILVNNAVIFHDKLFYELTEDDWDSVIAVILKGAFNMCRHAVPIMRQQKYGRIVNTTSGQWRNPEGRANYAAAKGSVVSLTWDLAWELRNDGITVNAIAPFAIGRNNQAAFGHEKSLADAGLKVQKRQHHMRGGPECVAPMVAYLVSDLASNVNGRVFYVAGGTVALYSHPEESRGIFKDHVNNGPWTIEELTRLLPSTVLGRDTKAPHIPD
ncbi:SDR family oxidoreductase [Chloroflexota bacterium]